jgi:hypothetical protein
MLQALIISIQIITLAALLIALAFAALGCLYTYLSLRLRGDD